MLRWWWLPEKEVLGTHSHSPAVLPLGEEAVTTGDMDDCKGPLHRSGPYTNPTIARSADDHSNSPSDQANNTADGDGAPDNADMTDTDTFEPMTQTQPSGFQVVYSTASDPEDISSAKSESPSGNLSNPEDISSAESESHSSNSREPSSADTRPQLFVEHFPHGKPSAPIDNIQGTSIYKSSQDVLGEAVWSPFQSQSDWEFGTSHIGLR